MHPKYMNAEHYIPHAHYTYLKYSLYPLMHLFGKNSMSDVDNLLTSFYQLYDEGRKEIGETIQFQLQYHRDAERAELVKQLKGW